MIINYKLFRSFIENVRYADKEIEYPIEFIGLVHGFNSKIS